MIAVHQRGTAVVASLALIISGALVSVSTPTATATHQTATALVRPSKAGAIKYVEVTEVFGGRTGKVVKAHQVLVFSRPSASKVPESRQAVIMQFTVTNAKQAGTITVWPDTEKRSKTPIIAFPKGNSSTSTLVRVGTDSPLKLVSTVTANLRVTVFGWVTGPAGAKPGPGGTQVVPAFSVLDNTATGSDQIRSGGDWVTLQATGKGGIPQSGVRAVWLAVQTTSRTDATMYLGTPEHEWEEIRAPIDDHWTTKQILARVDHNGRLCYKLSGATKPQVRLVVTGWIAEATAQDTVSTITGGLAPVEARAVTAKAVKIPAKYKSTAKMMVISLAQTTAVPAHAPSIMLRLTIKTKSAGYVMFGKNLKKALSATVGKGRLAARAESQIFGLVSISKDRKVYLALPKDARLTGFGLEGYGVKPLTLPAAPAGSVWAWGDNNHGSLGRGFGLHQASVPIQVNGLRNIVAIAAGYAGGRALDSSGVVWSWGWNGMGQLGDGSNYTSPVPIRVKDLPPAKAIAAGSASTYAVARDGTVWAWGTNSSGRLGDGTTASSSIPVQVKDLTRIMAVAVADNSAYALDADGAVWAWGANANNELGNSSGQTSNTPIKVSGLSQVVAIEAGPDNGYALTVDGDVYAWGANWYNQITTAATGQTFPPTKIAGLPKVASIAAYSEGAYAVARDGTVWSWGGHGTPKRPWQVPDLGNIIQVSPYSADMGYAVQSDGTLWAWGDNTYGQLGDGTTNFAKAPRRIIGLKKITAVAQQLGVGAYALTH